MSTKQLKLKIVTPERLVLEDMVDRVTMPTVDGEITVLPNHIPIVVRLKSGDIVAQAFGEFLPVAVVSGFVEVKKDTGTGITEVTILADFAEHVGELSDQKIAEAKAKAEELRQKFQNNEIVDFEHFEVELERSLTRAKIGDKWKTRKYRK